MMSLLLAFTATQLTDLHTPLGDVPTEYTRSSADEMLVESHKL